MSDNNQEFPYASSLKLEEATITGLDGTELPIKPLIKSFQYFEDIDMPSISVNLDIVDNAANIISCLLYTSPSPRDQRGSRMPSSA